MAGADKVLIPSAVLTLLTGLGLMRMTQGFIEAPWRFWAGFGLTVVLLLIAKLGLEPTKKQLVVAVQGSGEAAALGSLRGRFIALVTAWHLGFLVILTLMVYPF
ncbi:MAG: hypothetical protein EOO72_01745 [Myxococcaceae bacterium]|nr:MAG: hypothetical protein EOO72_01745 [Myxococcaceae bacterium]